MPRRPDMRPPTPVPELKPAKRNAAPARNSLTNEAERCIAAPARNNTGSGKACPTRTKARRNNRHSKQNHRSPAAPDKRDAKMSKEVLPI